MKLYRYQFKDGKIKIDEFEAEYCKRSGIFSYYRIKKTNYDYVKEVDIDYIRYDYIMWSLSNKNKNKFIELIIKKKQKIINGLIDKIEKQRCCIEFLNKELVEDD